MDFHVRDVEIINDSVNLDGIIKEMTTIIEKYELEGYNQISLQSYKPDADPLDEWETGNGKVWDLPVKEEEFVHPLFPEAELLNSYIKEFSMYRTRIMKLFPGKVMSVHHDRTPRIHLPISTNDGCRMMIGHQCYHLEPGKMYWTDTRLEHTAFNGGPYPRIHIVGCVKGE
jgi:hypothetical protein